MTLPPGMSESQWNNFCDSQKCKYGNYCNFILGLCPRCKEDIERFKKEQEEVKE